MFRTVRAETGQQKSSLGLRGVRTSCCWFSTWPHLRSWTSISPRKMMVLWLPGNQGLPSPCPSLVLELLIFLWRSCALVSENTGPDPSKTPLPWQKRPSIDIRQILLSSGGEKCFPAAAPLEPDSLHAVKCWSSTNTWRKSVVWIYCWKKMCWWLASHASCIVATLIKYLIISSGT